MIIADHHKPGHPMNFGWEPEYSPVKAWPADCFVQWGSSGVVLSRNPNKESYRTAFFEAFPNDPPTFIRGEGATVAAAEVAAFAKWEKYLSCLGHEFERRDYRNGAGFCKHCGLFRSGAFEPLETCCICNTPTFHSLTTDGRWWCVERKAQRPIELISPLERMLMDRTGRYKK
jgi:hypothetical protein